MKQSGSRTRLSELRTATRMLRCRWAENARPYFLRRKGLAFSAHLHLNMRVAVRSSDNLVRDPLCFILDLFKFPTHEAFNGENRILRVSHGLSFCGLTD